MLSFNEGKACDAIIRHLEHREGQQRSNIRSPEKQMHPAPIELAFNLGKTLYALEHTGIEPFEGHVKMEAQAPYLFQPLIDALDGTLGSSASFQLNIPVMALDKPHKRDIPAIHSALIEWVRAIAPTLPKRDNGPYRGFRGPENIPGVPFPVSLYRYDKTIKAGGFELRHVVSSDIESARFSRIEAACKKKFPKLAAWKRHEGARSVLVLEENDLQITNHALVAESFLKMAATRGDRPDETYLVSTCTDQWYVCPLLVDDKDIFKLEQEQWPVAWPVDRETLIDLTNS